MDFDINLDSSRRRNQINIGLSTLFPQYDQVDKPKSSELAMLRIVDMDMLGKSKAIPLLTLLVILENFDR